MHRNLGDGLNYLAKFLSYFVNVSVVGADNMRSKEDHKHEKTRRKSLSFEGLILLDT
jgi:hypothetical protein